MFKSDKLTPAYTKNLIGWRNHCCNFAKFDIDAGLQTSESGSLSKINILRYDLTTYKALYQEIQDLEEYLALKVETAINRIFNDIIRYEQYLTMEKPY